MMPYVQNQRCVAVWTFGPTTAIINSIWLNLHLDKYKTKILKGKKQPDPEW